jgi:coproporphyrinogen III oxidase-like Fe-S oxidoreductase
MFRRIFLQHIANGSRGSTGTNPSQSICTRHSATRYCGRNLKLAARYSPVATHARHLLEEADLIADVLPVQMPVSHLHFGGGTPTVLEPEDLCRGHGACYPTLSAVARCRVAIESDPRLIKDSMIDQIGSLRFNRASFGVQEFDPKVQGDINQIQLPEMVERWTKSLRAVGVPDINFDLIYGLPHQNIADRLTFRLLAEFWDLNTIGMSKRFADPVTERSPSDLCGWKHLDHP